MPISKFKTTRTTSVTQVSLENLHTTEPDTVTDAMIVSSSTARTEEPSSGSTVIGHFIPTIGWPNPITARKLLPEPDKASKRKSLYQSICKNQNMAA